MKQNLVKYIMNETQFLNLPVMNDNETKLIIEYFLNKNIQCLLGKTDFNINENEKSELLINTDGSRLNIDFGGNRYIIDCILVEDIMSLTIQDLNQEYARAEISINATDKTYSNLVAYYNDDVLMRENQKVNIIPSKEFEYQKEVCYKDGEVEKYPKYMMVPAGVKRNPDDEMFKIISPEVVSNKNDSFLKRIIDEVKNPSLVPIKTNYGDYNILEYIEKIYDVMEEKTREYEESKKL